MNPPSTALSWFRLVALVFVGLASGCSDRQRRDARTVHDAAGALGTVAAAVVAVGRKIDQPSRPPETAESDPPRRFDDPAAPSTNAALRAPPFDPARAQAALTNVDLINCRGSAPHGYGRAAVTLRPSGEITRVVIDAPTVSAAAAKCIGGELGRATVPAFRGSAMTIGTTWYVP